MSAQTLVLFTHTVFVGLMLLLSLGGTAIFVKFSTTLLARPHHQEEK